MKRTAMALTLVMALSFSALAVTQVIKLGTANPTWLLYFPTEPVKTSPTIIFQSPIEDQTYESNSVWLNFTIIKPESWFLPTNTGYDEEGNPATFIFINITSVRYMIDNVTSETIPVSDLTSLIENFSPNRSLNFSTIITLPPGAHNLVVNMQGDSYYRPTEVSSYPPPSKIQVDFSSEIVTFRIAESFPTTLVVASMVVVTVIGVGLLVYFKKRKR